MNPWGFGMYERPKVALLQLFVSIVLIVAAVLFWKKGRSEFFGNKWVWWLSGAWLFSMLLSTVFSVAPVLSFWGSYTRIQGFYTLFLCFLLFVFCLKWFRSKESIEIFFKVVIASCFLVSIYAVLQKLGFDIFSETKKEVFVGRSFSTMGHPNFLGQLMIFPIWMSMYFVFKLKSWKPRISWILLALLFLFVMLLTENRASLLGIMASAVIFVIISTKYSKKIKGIILGLVTVTPAVFVLLFASSSRSLGTRFLLWGNNFSAWLENPWIGSGPETYYISFQKVFPPELLGTEMFYDIADRAHNVLMDVLVMRGMLGVAVTFGIIAVITVFVIKSWAKLKRTNMHFIPMMLISYGVSMMFGFSMITHLVVLCAVFAILINQGKIQSLQIKLTTLTGFFSGGIVVLALFNALFAGMALKADFEHSQGMSYFFKMSQKKAYEHMIKSVTYNPFQDAVYLSAADIAYAYSKDDPKSPWLKIARKMLENASNFSNSDFHSVISRARIETYSENFNLADKMYKKGETLAPTNPILWKDWGVMHYRNKNYKESILKLEKFLELSPKYWKWKLKLKDHSFSEREKYRIFFKHADDVWIVFSYLSRSYAEIGNIKKSRLYLQFIDDESAIKTIERIIKEKAPSV